MAVDVRTPCPALWENSPHLTPLADGAAGAEEIACGYPPVHRSNTGPWQFIHGFTQFPRFEVKFRNEEARGFAR